MPRPGADPEGYVRVPGHGAVRLQIVPTITGLEGDPAADPGLTIRGTGFACGQTQVLVGGNPIPSGEILSLQCGTIQLKDAADERRAARGPHLGRREHDGHRPLKIASVAYS